MFHFFCVLYFNSMEFLVYIFRFHSSLRHFHLWNDLVTASSFNLFLCCIPLSIHLTVICLKLLHAVESWNLLKLSMRVLFPQSSMWHLWIYISSRIYTVVLLDSKVLVMFNFFCAIILKLHRILLWHFKILFFQMLDLREDWW